MRGDTDAMLLAGRCLGVDESAGALATLRHELGAPERDWCRFVALVNRHRVTPALWASLRRKECSDALPDDLQSYLAAILQRNARRNHLLRQQAYEAVAALNERDIRPVVLKGGLQLFEPGFDRAARIVADLDLLVPRAGFETAADALCKIGYLILDASRDRSKHSLTLSRSDSLATIDLHRDLGPQRHLLPADVALADSVPLSIDGVVLMSLSPTHRALHTIVNTAVTDPHYRMATVALCRLYDLVLLSQRHAAAIDWNAVCRGMAHGGLEHAVTALLYLTRQLFGMPLPIPLTETVRARLYVQRYLLQLHSAPLRSIGRLWGRITHSLSRVRMDYFYACGRNPLHLAGARLRHVRGMLRRRDVKIRETIANDIRAD